MKTLEATRFNELAKKFLFKTTSTDANKIQTVFVLVHQKIGFVNAKMHYIEIQNLDYTKEGNGNHIVLESKKLNSNQ